MIKFKAKIALIATALLLSSGAQGTSLDEIYRDVIRSDNSGYLPIYVKNRNAPQFLLDEEKLKEAQNIPPVVTEPQKNMVIDFEDYRLKREQEETAKTERWLKAIEAVKKNNVKPMDLHEIETREEASDPTATEILAFMYARGIGVKMNLIKAFKLYRKAEQLNVPNAKDNAIKVYKVMTPDQRAKLNTSSNN